MKIFVALECTNDELNNLDNDIEYIFIDTLTFLNRNLISNLPVLLKSIHINNFDFYEISITENWINRNNKVALFDTFFDALLQIKLPFNCEIHYNAKANVQHKRKTLIYEVDTLYCFNNQLNLSDIEITTNYTNKFILQLNGCGFYISPKLNNFLN